MNDSSTSMPWLETSLSFTPELEHTTEINSAFQEFAKLHLSQDTRIRVLHASSSTSTNPEYAILDEEKLEGWLNHAETSQFAMFFMNRFLVKPKQSRPTDAAKLRVSPVALNSILEHVTVAPAFVYSFSRYHLPAGKGHRTWVNSGSVRQHDLWYSLPVRMKVPCTEPLLRHSSSTGGNNQSDPFHYLHLVKNDIDIRGARIFLYFSYKPASKSTSVIAINMLDGRWPKPVEEPQKRIRDILRDPRNMELREDPCFIHLVYFTSALKWWTNALASVDLQLISYEQELQLNPALGSKSEFQDQVSKALHAMAAHLHRYASELNSLEEILSDIKDYHQEMYAESQAPKEVQFKRIEYGLQQLNSQLGSIKNFEAELEKKLQNILALLFNNIQLGNDLAMQKILKATQDETEASQAMAVKTHELTVEMKKDSLSMKTIAMLTMFFLPGTSFAALLSMPFFAQNPWLDNASRFWVWVVLTVPATGLAFAFYLYWRRRAERGTKPSEDNEGGLELTENVGGK